MSCSAELRASLTPNVEPEALSFVESLDQMWQVPAP